MLRRSSHSVFANIAFVVRLIQSIFTALRPSSDSEIKEALLPVFLCTPWNKFTESQRLKHIANMREDELEMFISKSSLAVWLFGGKPCGKPLEGSSQRFRNDSAVVLAAVSSDGMSLNYASEELKNDRAVCSAALIQNSKAFEYMGESIQLQFHSNDAFAGEIISRNGSNIKNASDSQRQNASLCLLAVEQDHLSYFLIPREMQRLGQLIEVADLWRRLDVPSHPLPEYWSHFKPWCQSVRHLDPFAATILVPYYEGKNQEREREHERARERARLEELEEQRLYHEALSPFLDAVAHIRVDFDHYKECPVRIRSIDDIPTHLQRSPDFIRYVMIGNTQISAELLLCGHFTAAEINSDLNLMVSIIYCLSVSCYKTASKLSEMAELIEHIDHVRTFLRWSYSQLSSSRDDDDDDDDWYSRGGNNPFLQILLRLPSRFVANEQVALAIGQLFAYQTFPEHCIEVLIQEKILPTIKDRSTLAIILQRTASAFALIPSACALVPHGLALEPAVIFSGKISVKILKFAAFNGLLTAANKEYILEAILRTPRMESDDRSFVVLPLLGGILKQDRDIVIAAIETASRKVCEFKHAPPLLRGDPEVALAAAKRAAGDFCRLNEILNRLPREVRGPTANFDFVKKFFDFSGRTRTLDPRYLKHISPALSEYHKLVKIFMGQPCYSLSCEQEMKRAVSSYLARVRDYRRRSKLTFDVSFDGASIDDDSESEEAEIEDDSDNNSDGVHEQDVDHEEDEKFFANHAWKEFASP